MSTEHNVLLASHGTKGAIAAERAALDMCKKGDRLHHLLVVPTLWEGMTGDDWLNNGSTRNRFRRYLESELEKEVIEHILEEKELLAPSQKRKFYEIIVDQFSFGGLGVHDVKGRKMD